MRVYLSLAIDRSPASKEATTKVLDGIKDGWVTSRPLVLFKPADAFQVALPHSMTPRDDAYIVDLNEQALHQADAMLLVYNPGTESWGVPQELLMAYRWEIPVFVYSPVPAAEMPIYMRSRIKPEQVFSNITDLALALSATEISKTRKPL